MSSPEMQESAGDKERAEIIHIIYEKGGTLHTGSLRKSGKRFLRKPHVQSTFYRRMNMISALFVPDQWAL